MHCGIVQSSAVVAFTPLNDCIQTLFFHYVISGSSELFVIFGNATSVCYGILLLFFHTRASIVLKDKKVI